MKIKLLRGTVVDGKRYPEAGKVVDASDYAAKLLIATDKAEPYEEKRGRKKKRQ